MYALQCYRTALAFLTAIVVITVFVVVEYQETIQQLFFGISLKESQIDSTIKQISCRIPNVDPFDKTALKLIFQDEPREKPKCIKEPNVKFYSDYEDLIMLNETSSYWNGVSCCYVGYYHHDFSAPLVEGSSCHPISGNVTHIPTKFGLINVKCYKKEALQTFNHENSSVVYEDQFLFYRINPNNHNKTSMIDSEGTLPNIIFFGLDTVSQQNFIRFLPKTREYLLQNLSAIEFHGRNKVSLGTQGNILAMLTGCKIVEGTPNPASFPCNLVWKEFSQKGYTVIRTEDEDCLVREFYPVLKQKRNGTPDSDEDWLPYIAKVAELNKDMNGSHFNFGCYQNQWNQNMQVNRIVQVAQQFEKIKRPYFHFVWSVTATHDVISFTRYMDKPLYKMLSQLHTQKFLDNTIFILASDHGMVYATYSTKTTEGSIEARMPLLYFVFPKLFQEKYSKAMENVKSNTMKLTTPYDLHATIKQLSNLVSLSNDRLQMDDIESLELKRNSEISLFRQIPFNRTCAAAGIADVWCICYGKKPVQKPEMNLQVVKSVDLAILELNKHFVPFPVCQNLSLKAIEDARKFTASFASEYLYEIEFRTSPGDALFEVTASVDNYRRYKIIGNLVRVNAYHRRGACLDKYESAPKFVESACNCGGRLS